MVLKSRRCRAPEFLYAASPDPSHTMEHVVNGDAFSRVQDAG